MEPLPAIARSPIHEPGNLKTIGPVLQGTGPSQDFKTEVDTLMKAIQAKVEMAKPPADAEASRPLVCSDVFRLSKLERRVLADIAGSSGKEPRKSCKEKAPVYIRKLRPSLWPKDSSRHPRQMPHRRKTIRKFFLTFSFLLAVKILLTILEGLPLVWLPSYFLSTRQHEGTICVEGYG